MPQDLIFVRRTHGVSKKGVDYDIIEVSNGLALFTLQNGVDSDFWKDAKEKDSFSAYVHVEPSFNGIRGKIVEANWN